MAKEKFERKKPHVNVGTIGHVDHGKSTTVGRLFFDSGIVTEQELQKLKEEAAKHGKAGFEFAYVMDNLKEERERGVTINLSYKKQRQITFQLVYASRGLNAQYQGCHQMGRTQLTLYQALILW